MANISNTDLNIFAKQFHTSRIKFQMGLLSLVTFGNAICDVSVDNIAKLTFGSIIKVASGNIVDFEPMAVAKPTRELPASCIV
jgi:hypothetical protein